MAWKHGTTTGYAYGCRCEKCREAICEYQRRYYAENREAERERDRRYRAENREAIREYNRRYNAENREAKREYQRRYDAENREAKREYQRRYDAENREAKRERDRRYRAENREAKREYHRRYRAENREAIREYNRRGMKRLMRKNRFTAECATRTGLPWSAEEDARIQEPCDDRLMLALDMGRTIAAIENRRKALRQLRGCD